MLTLDRDGKWATVLWITVADGKPHVRTEVKLMLSLFGMGHVAGSLGTHGVCLDSYTYHRGLQGLESSRR